MGIYRGPGGTGDAVNDAASEALITVQAKDAALAAQAAAELAETNAETAETNAETAETNAETAATNAANSASAASTSASNAASSASAASTSASNASTSATNAANSASAASTSASNAAASASTATTQATNASNSASAAATSATNAAASYDSFDDRYLGAKSSAPTLDNDGNTLLVGALYFNTTTNEMKVWDGSTWLNAYASLSGALLATNNLSDLNNTATARTNLGVAIGVNVQAYDADLTTLGAGGSAARSFLGLAIGTDVQAYDAQLADIAGLTPTDNNFIVGNGTNFVTESGSTARTSLGLGSIATQDANNVAVTGGSINGTTVGASTAASGAFTSLTSSSTTTLNGTTIPASKTLVVTTDIGSTVQAYDAQLADVAGLTPADNNFIVGNGTNFVTESGSTARTSLGLGSIATQDANNVAVTGGSINGTTIGATTASTGKFTTLEATGVTTVQAGTAALPSITTSGDTNTGIYFPTADTIAFSEGGSEQMRLTSTGNLQMNSGYGSVATAYGCRAWINFDGTGTPTSRQNGNVSSITDNGTGDYTINFTNGLTDANYALAGSANTGSSFTNAVVARSFTSSGARFVTSNANNATDFDLISVVVFR
jgi:hypothetical protein